MEASNRRHLPAYLASECLAFRVTDWRYYELVSSLQDGQVVQKYGDRHGHGSLCSAGRRRALFVLWKANAIWEHPKRPDLFYFAPILNCSIGIEPSRLH